MSTLCQETKIHLNQKVGSEGTPKIGPVLEVTTCCSQGKYGVEIRIWSLNKDKSHSWVRFSHGLNKLVTNLNKDSEMQFEDYALKFFSQIAEPVICREYTLPPDGKSTDPKGWIQRITKIGLVLEVKTSYPQGKYGVEIRIVNQENSHLWVRISHGSHKMVTNLNNSEQETSEAKFEEYALRLNARDFAFRSKAKAKPQKRDSASSSTRTIPIGERTWTDIQPQEYSLTDYLV